MVKKFDVSCLPVAPNFSFELPLWTSGLVYVAGLDEAGRGALAGPVAAGAIVFPPDPGLVERLVGVRDSKQMTPVERQDWAGRLVDIGLACAVGFASHQEIDRAGIVLATRLAMKRALEGLKLQPEHLLVDYIELDDCQVPYTALVKGDARSLSIAAASILAKTGRDALMRQFDVEYPDYGFAIHKGYGTAAHLSALRAHGPSPIHRQSFKPVSCSSYFSQEEKEA